MMEPSRPSVRFRTGPSLAGTLTLLGLILTVSCSTGVRNPYASGGGSRRGEGSRSYLVRLQASCGVCNVTWEAGTQRGGEPAQGLWSETVRVYLMSGERSMARVYASPASGGGGISWVRISVNGKVAAEETRETATGRGEQGSVRPLVVETPLPPPPDRIKGDPAPGGR